MNNDQKITKKQVKAQVKLQRWRVAFTLISTLIALATLGILFFRQ